MFNAYIEPISILSIFAISFYIIRKNFDLSIYLLLIFSTFLHKELFSFFRWDLMPIRMFMFALLCSFAVDISLKLLNDKGRKDLVKDYFKNTAVLILLGIWIVNGLSIYFSLNVKASVLLYGFFTSVIALFVLLFNRLHDDEAAAVKYIKAYIFIAFAFTLIGYIQYIYFETTGNIFGALWNVPNNIPRIGAFFWDINHYGAFLAALLPISSVLVLNEKKVKAKIGYTVISLSLLVGLLLTNSRSAWIMIFVAFIVFMLSFLYRSFGKKGIALLFAVLLLLSATVGFLYSQKDGLFRLKVKQYFHYRLDSFDSHVLLLRGAFEIFESYPILGGGYGGFFEHFSKTDVGPEFFGRDPAAFTTRVPAHTIWGEVLSGSGILGTGLFVLFVGLVIGTLFYTAHTAKDKRVFLMSSSMMSVLIGWLTAGIFYSYNSEFFWIIWVLFFSYGAAASKVDTSFKKVIDYFFNSKGFSQLAILGFSALLIFWSLGTNHLIPWDEAIYAEISKNMVTSGEYVSQTWKPMTVWYEKPPLYMWFEAFFMSFLGFTSLAVRLPSAIAGLLTLVLVYKLSAKIFNRTAAFISVLTLVTTVHFLYYSRAGMLDVTTTFFFTLAVYLYHLLKEKPKTREFLMLGAAVGFAAMTKGAVGLLPLPTIFLFEVFSKNRFKIRNYLTILLGFAVIALPWHIEMYRRYGQQFLNNYIGYHVLDRATVAIEDKGNPIWWYLIILRVSLRVWAIALLGAFPFALYKLIKKDYRTLPFLIWFMFVFSLFSLAKSKLVWYIIPVYPAIAILNGYFLSEALSELLAYLPKKSHNVLKMLSLYVLLLFSFVYLIMNKDLVYTSDLTGSVARLMQQKEMMSEKITGPNSKVFLDRIELPLALYYLDSPFEIIDFSPTKRVPYIADDQAMILITKKGRYSEQVFGYTVPSTIVAEDGDWVLWYLPAKTSTTL